MAFSLETSATFAAAGLLRIAVFIFLPGITTALAERVEISTPISSYKRLLEGLFLFERGVSPYDGGVYHQAPLLLLIFELLPAAVVFVGLDLLNAYNLTLIASRLKVHTPRFQKLNSTQISAFYLFNPFTILSCLGASTTAFTNAAVIQAVAGAATGNAFEAMFALAFGTHLSLYPGFLLPPLILLWSQSKAVKLDIRRLAGLLGIFLGAIAGLLIISAVLVDDFKDFLVSCYGAQISLTDLTPNIGLWWYFFIEIFDSFRSFFIGVFWIHLMGYVGALTFRLPEQPLFVIIALTGLIAIFKPYPSTSDVALYFGLLPLYQHIMPCKSGIRVFLHKLTCLSDQIHIRCSFCSAVLNPTRTCLLSYLDLRWIRQC